MGKVTSGIFGSVSGKVGGAVGASWKGIHYWRAYAIPGNPNTIAQQDVRNIFRILQFLAGLFLLTISQKFWDPFIRRQSGYNHFIGYNLPNLANPTDFPAVLVANGKLEGNLVTSTTYSGLTGMVTFVWPNAPIGNGLGTDSIVLVVYDSANKVGFVKDSGDQRSALTKDVNVGLGRVAADLKCYLFAYRGFGTSNFIVSPSTFDQCV